MLKWNQLEKKKASLYQSNAKILRTEHQYWPTGVRHLLCISIKKRSPKLLIVRRFWISFVQEEKLSKIPEYHCTVVFVSGLRHNGSCRTLVGGHLWCQNYGTSATLLALGMAVHSNQKYNKALVHKGITLWFKCSSLVCQRLSDKSVHFQCREH